MNTVQPITDPELIADILDYLRQVSMRNYMLFYIGINTGFRISDILRFRVRDVIGTHINIREKKTKKEKRLLISAVLRRELKAFVEGRQPHEYLFQSRQGVNRPIGRSMAYKIMRTIADVFKLVEVGCHTLRKTFGYFHYKTHKDIVLLQNHFNHSAYKITLRYIGELQETMDTSMKSFRIV
ncbi:tyrosine-type recombinase/integrase [Paenibacillus sp. OV219]|uniref:tyrosine-type recombinase/integrase n=1 Tax=Paenibacillus sp. OV219 TaxID=1884377 RepID=UPI0008B57A8D|nr:tyrosine-type recombinase/integrase [Paenibacillus sp. OV219]SEM81180.1 Phage integrase family protein [Paenibacillus sp. OV219]